MVEKEISLEYGIRMKDKVILGMGIVIEVKGLGLRYDEHVLKTRAWSWNKKIRLSRVWIL
jgi:hypothetical protein